MTELETHITNANLAYQCFLFAIEKGVTGLIAQHPQLARIQTQIKVFATQRALGQLDDEVFQAGIALLKARVGGVE